MGKRMEEAIKRYEEIQKKIFWVVVSNISSDSMAAVN